MGDEKADGRRLGRGGLMSVKRKRAAVVRLLRGEDLETVSRELAVTAVTQSAQVAKERAAPVTIYIVTIPRRKMAIGCPLIDNAALGDHHNAGFSDGKFFPVFLKVVADGVTGGYGYILIDYGPSNPRMMTDGDVFHENRVFYVGMALYLSVRRKDRMAYFTIDHASI